MDAAQAFSNEVDEPSQSAFNRYVERVKVDVTSYWGADVVEYLRDYADVPDDCFGMSDSTDILVHALLYYIQVLALEEARNHNSTNAVHKWYKEKGHQYEDVVLPPTLKEARKELESKKESLKKETKQLEANIRKMKKNIQNQRAQVKAKIEMTKESSKSRTALEKANIETMKKSSKSQTALVKTTVEKNLKRQTAQVKATIKKMKKSLKRKTTQLKANIKKMKKNRKSKTLKGKAKIEEREQKLHAAFLREHALRREEQIQFELWLDECAAEADQADNKTRLALLESTIGRVAWRHVENRNKVGAPISLSQLDPSHRTAITNAVCVILAWVCDGLYGIQLDSEESEEDEPEEDEPEEEEDLDDYFACVIEAALNG